MKLEALTLEDVEKIDSATRFLLDQIGLGVGSEKALQIFASAGARVDFDQKRVCIPSELLDNALSTLPGSFTLCTRDGTQEMDLQDGQIRGHNVGGCVQILDFETLAPRPATRRDLEEATILIDALENIHVCRPVVYPEEFPSSVRDIHVAATMLQFTTKPYGFSAYSLENLAYIIEIAGLVSGSLEAFLDKPFLWGSVCPVSPLYYNQSTTEILMRYAEYGMPVAVAPCPTSGGTGPVTLAGTLVQQNAEFLFGLVLVQIINPGTPVKYTTRPIVLDMRTASSAFGAIEMGMMSAAIVELANHYGVCSDVYGLATSAKTLDEQTAFEKALNGVMPALAGANLVASVGMLEDALTSSIEQLVIDDEILGIILHAARGITVSEETLALEAIARVGPQGDFLTDEHTARHFRQECHYPELSFRTGSASWRKGGYQTILDAARDRASTLINEHQPERLDAKVVDAIEQVLLEADETLGPKFVSHV